MKAIIALGSNLGDKFNYLQSAVEKINKIKDVEILKISSVYETVPVGGPVQDDYLNAVIQIESKLESEILLQKLQSIEVELDRVREERWGPRTIDLDIVAIEDQQHNSPNLTIPHPLAHERCFVLIPWFEIDPTSALVNKGIVANLITKLDCKELTIYQQRLVNK